MFKSVFVSLIFLMNCLVFLVENAKSSESIFVGRLEEARAHFFGEGMHMGGVIFFSEAIFKTRDGSIIPQSQIKYSVTMSHQKEKKICFQFDNTKCETLRIKSQYLLPIMSWIKDGGKSAFTAAPDFSFKFLKKIRIIPSRSLLS